MNVNAPRYIALMFVAFFPVGCGFDFGKKDFHIVEVEQREIPDVVSDALDSINRIEKTDLDHAFFPQKSIEDGYMVNGETKAWLYEHEKILDAKGFVMIWIAVDQKVIALSSEVKDKDLPKSGERVSVRN